MITELEKFLGIKIERPEHVLPSFIQDQLKRKYPNLEQQKELEHIIYLIPFFLLSSQEMDAAGEISRIALIEQLMPIDESLSQSDLKDNLMAISPYIYFEFLTTFLKPETATRLSKRDVVLDDYVQKAMLGLKQKHCVVQLEDKFLFNKIYRHITSIVYTIKSPSDFKLYANLISVLIDHCGQGEEILTFLINEIHNKYQQNLAPLRDIIPILEKSKIGSINQGCRELLRQIKKEIEFAQTEPDRKAFHKSIEILDIYSTNINYPIIGLRYLNTKKIKQYFQKRILQNDLSREELGLLKEQLKKRDFLNLFVQTLDKPTLDRLCKDIQEEQITQSIKNSQHYRYKTQSGRIALILKIDEDDLRKTGQNFIDIIKIIDEKELDDSGKMFLRNLLVLSSQSYFEDLPKTKQLGHIKDLIKSFEDLSLKNDDIIAAYVHCLVKSTFSLINLGSDEERGVLRTIAAHLNSYPIISERIIENGELKDLQFRISQHYQNIADRIEHPYDNKEFAEQLLILNILDQKNLFEDFIKALFIKHQTQLPKLIEIITSIKQSVVRIINPQEQFEILFKEPHQEFLDQTIKECQLYHSINSKTLTPITAIFNFRELSQINPYAPANLIDDSFNKIKDFLKEIDFKERQFGIIISEMNKNDQFLKFTLQQQSEQQIKALVEFLSKNISDQNSLLAKRMIHYYSDDKNSDGSESWSIMATLVNEKTLKKLLPQPALTDQELEKLFKKTPPITKKEKTKKTPPKPSPKITQSIQIQSLTPTSLSQPNLSDIETMTDDPKTIEEEKVLEEVMLESTDYDLDEVMLPEVEIKHLKQQNLDLGDQLKKLESTIKKKNEKLKSASLSARQTIKKIIKNLSTEAQTLREEINKNDARIKELIFKLTLEEESDKITKELSTDCPNIRTLLKNSPISPQVFGISGSRVYSGVIKAARPNTKFKDRRDQQDWDLYCLVDDQRFNIGLFNNEDSARDFCGIYLKDFEVKTVNISRGNSVSFKLAHKDTKVEFDLNIYPKSRAEEMHQWQYYYDRIMLDISEENQQFIINNNGLEPDQHLDFDQFVDKLSKNPEFDLWQTNEKAKKFLPRFLKGSGTLEMPYKAWSDLKPILKKEFFDIVNRISQIPEIQSIVNQDQKFVAIKQHFFDGYKIDSEQKDRKISDIGEWFEDYKVEMLTTRPRVNYSTKPSGVATLQSRSKLSTVQKNSYLLPE
jgi:hypothetical protein